MSKIFTSIYFLGNAWCAAVWLGNYNKNSNPVDFKDDEKVKEFIVAKVTLSFPLTLLNQVKV